MGVLRRRGGLKRWHGGKIYGNLLRPALFLVRLHM